MEKINWMIWYFWLSDRRLSTFSEKEKEHILKTFIPMWFWKGNLIEDQITFSTDNPVFFLSALAGWFKKENDRTIAYRMLEQWEKMINNKTNIVDIHFFYQSKWEIYYQNRNFDNFALNEAIKSFKKQIEISEKSIIEFKKEYKNEPRLPTHKWYEQLAIIKEKEWKYNEAINLCKDAMKQWRWWDRQHRIDRLSKKELLKK